MKTMRHKKSLSSILAMLLALALIAGSTYALVFVVGQTDDEDVILPFGATYDFKANLYPKEAYFAEYNPEALEAISAGNYYGFFGLIFKSFGVDFDTEQLFPGYEDELDEHFGFIQNWGNKDIGVKLDLSKMAIYVYDDVEDDYVVCDTPSTYGNVKLAIPDIPENADFFDAGGAVYVLDGEIYLTLPANPSKADKVDGHYDGPKLYLGYVFEADEPVDEGDEGYFFYGRPNNGGTAVNSMSTKWAGFSFMNAIMTGDVYGSAADLPISISVDITPGLHVEP